MLLLVPKSMFHKGNRCLYSAFPSVYTVVAENQARGCHLCHDALWYVVCPSASGHALVAAFSVPDRGGFFTRLPLFFHPTGRGFPPDSLRCRHPTEIFLSVDSHFRPSLPFEGYCLPVGTKKGLLYRKPLGVLECNKMMFYFL